MPNLEKPVVGPTFGPILPRNETALFCAVLVGLFALSSRLLNITIPIPLHGIVAVCFVCLVLAVPRRLRKDRQIATLGLVATFATLLVEVFVLGSSGADYAQVGLVLSFYLAAIAMRKSTLSSGNLALVTGMSLVLFSWLSLTFGQPFLGGSIGLSSTMICLASGFGVAMRFADAGFLRLLNTSSLIAKNIRIQLLASVLGPWVFGLLLYRVFGVMERALALEQLLIGITIMGLVAVVYRISLVSQQEEIRHQKDLETLRRKAVTDVLTGLPNRAGIADRLDDVWREFQMAGTNSAVIIFDLDHFKSINDTFGHDGGDLVLKSVKAVVKPVMRSGDAIGRWGGEEFLCILPGAETDQVQMIAERLRAAIEGLTEPLSRSLGAPCLISASFGVAQFSNKDKDSNAVVKRADEALYASKSSGRNRVSIVGSISLLQTAAVRSASTA